MNVLIDLGTHFGQGLEFFIRRFGVDESWHIETFEANPTTHDIFLSEHIKKFPSNVWSHNTAVSTFEGYIDLNIETPPGEGDTGMGTSIIGLDVWEPWNGTLKDNFQKIVTVPCIDFSSYLATNFSPDDTIIIKMDIEGAEYDILEKMIDDGTLNMIDHISVEWHSRFFTNEEEMKRREDAILIYAIQNKIQMESWW